jgi:hypothetical protein
MSAAVFGLRQLFRDADGFGAVVGVGAATMAGVTVYLAAARLLRVGELGVLFSFRQRTRGR